MSVAPSGLLPSSLKRPHGSREEEMWIELKANENFQTTYINNK
jgi:hypothetical protein